MTVPALLPRKAQIAYFQFEELIDKEPNPIPFNEIDPNSWTEHCFTLITERSSTLIENETVLRFRATVSSAAIQTRSEYFKLAVVHTRVVTIRFRFMNGEKVIYELNTYNNVLRINEQQKAEIAELKYRFIRMDAVFEDRKLPSDELIEKSTREPLSRNQAEELVRQCNLYYMKGYKDASGHLATEISNALLKEAEENPEKVELLTKWSDRIKEMATALKFPEN